MIKACKKMLAALAVIVYSFCFGLSAAAGEMSALAFDTPAGAAYWTIDNAELAATSGLSIKFSDAESFDGAGSAAVFENLVGDLPETMTGGAYITAESLGLENLSGCTVSFKIYPVDKALAAGAQITLYTDGMLYLPSNVTDWTANTWQDVTLTVPENCGNTRIGLLAPVRSTYSGDVFYIDEMVITLPDGSTVANRGDYSPPADVTEGGSEELSHTRAIWMMVLFVVSAVVAVAAVVFAFYKMSTRYR
jgi:hypothetical protein